MYLLGGRYNSLFPDSYFPVYMHLCVVFVYVESFPLYDGSRFIRPLLKLLYAIVFGRLKDMRLLQMKNDGISHSS